MNLARCDDCCAKLDGVDGHSVYVLIDEARELLNDEYEHLCEDCMDNINIDKEKLFINAKGIIYAYNK